MFDVPFIPQINKIFGASGIAVLGQILKQRTENWNEENCSEMKLRFQVSWISSTDDPEMLSACSQESGMCWGPAP